MLGDNHNSVIVPQIYPRLAGLIPQPTLFLRSG